MSTQRTLVAIDDGYAQIKLVADNPEGGPPVKRLFRSSVRAGRHSLRGMGGESRGGNYVTEEGQEYSVSEAIEGESTQFNGFHTSPMNRVLVMHALVQAGFSGREVDLVTGLPVADFYTDGGEVNKAKMDAKKANLRKGLRDSASREPTALPTLSTINIGCQAVSAWIDHTMDDDLEYRRDAKGDILAKGRVGVVDVGGRTTDIAVVINDGGVPGIDMGRIVTENVGVLDVYKHVMSAVRSKWGFDDKFTLAEQDRAVRERTIEIFGQEEDIGDLVDRAVADVSGRIERLIDARLEGGGSMKSIVFVGGGCALLKDLAKPFRNGHMAADPEFANAVGLYKYRLLSRKLKNQAA